MSFAPPPPYFKNYANWHLDKQGPAPPAPPENNEYVVFGELNKFELPHDSLSDHDQTQLFDDGAEPVLELKKLNMSILFNFLEMTDKLATKPAEAKAHIDQLKTLYVNIHHLLNNFREVQARETIVQYLQRQVDARKSAAETLQKSIIDSRAKIADITQRFEEQKSQTTDMPSLQVATNSATISTPTPLPTATTASMQVDVATGTAVTSIATETFVPRENEPLSETRVRELDATLNRMIEEIKNEL